MRPATGAGLAAHSEGLYNQAVPTELFGELKSYVRFGEADARRLAALAPVVEPHLPRIVERFYQTVMEHAGTRQVLAGGQQQVERLRAHLSHWLRSLFGGRYDDEFVRQHDAIGRTHVRIGLPQRYLLTALEVIWQELSRVIRESDVPEPAPALEALHKLLMLEAALMLESYKDAYIQRVQEAERRALEARLSRAEHLAEVGQLAASLAHELKNPLAGISGAIQVLREGIESNDPRRRVLDEILAQINRLDRTVKDLLAYARPRSPRFKRCNLHAVVMRVGSLLAAEPLFAERQFEYSGTDGLWIEADEHQIEQVLMNLLLNAAHATRPGDPISLRVGDEGQEVTIVVHDRGHGMDEETRRRAFEPFFTTKARGTGLGLAICQRIVASHHGSIEVDSAPGEGTTVVIRLPRRQPRDQAGEQG